MGALFGERKDVTGSGIGPDQFGILQDVTIDFSWEIRELYSQQQFPVDIARGKGKITGKAKYARIFGALYGDLFFGSTPTTGQTTVAENEPGTVPATPTYTVTVTNAANYIDDLGVYNATTGARFTRVTTPSATGQYSVNLSTGVYTFAAADASALVAISYIYTLTAGKTITINNQFMGFTPVFGATFYTIRSGAIVSGALALRLYACTGNRISLPTRLDDYTYQEFDFGAFSNAAGQIGTLSIAE